MISVVVPVWNGARYLAEALESIRAQTLAPQEILVVDDGSTDESASIAARYGTVLSQPHQGAAAARNRGIEAAQGPLVAFLDADDLWEPHKLERQMAAIADHDTVFTHLVHFLSPDLASHVAARRVCPPEPMPGVCFSSLLVRRALLEQVGPLVIDGGVGEFIELYGRAVDTGMRWITLRDALVRRRIHESNQTLVRQEERSGYVHALKAVLDRRRGKA